MHTARSAQPGTILLPKQAGARLPGCMTSRSHWFATVSPSKHLTLDESAEDKPATGIPVGTSSGGYQRFD